MRCELTKIILDFIPSDDNIFVSLLWILYIRQDGYSKNPRIQFVFLIVIYILKNRLNNSNSCWKFSGCGWFWKYCNGYVCWDLLFCCSFLPGIGLLASGLKSRHWEKQNTRWESCWSSHPAVPRISMALCKMFNDIHSILSSHSL